MPHFRNEKADLSRLKGWSWLMIEPTRFIAPEENLFDQKTPRSYCSPVSLQSPMMNRRSLPTDEVIHNPIGGKQ